MLAAVTEATFLCINDRSPTCLTCPSQKTSIIDLIFISLSVFGLCEAVTQEDTYFSDHFPSVVFFKRPPTRNNFFSHRFKHNKFLDKLFIDNLHASVNSLKEILSDQSLNSNHKYSYFTEHLLQQWPSNKSESRPSKRLSRNNVNRFSPPASWWNSVCQESVDARHGCLSTLKRQSTFSNYLTFKK